MNNYWFTDNKNPNLNFVNIMELRRFVKLFAVKPLLIIYAFQYTLQWTVSKYL